MWGLSDISVQMPYVTLPKPLGRGWRSCCGGCFVGWKPWEFGQIPENEPIFSFMAGVNANPHSRSRRDASVFGPKQRPGFLMLPDPAGAFSTTKDWAVADLQSSPQAFQSSLPGGRPTGESAVNPLGKPHGSVPAAHDLAEIGSEITF